MTKNTNINHHAITWLQDHGDALYRYALLQCRDTHQAEELVQETLLAGIESYHRFKQDSSVRTWLVGILKYKLLDNFRRQRRETSLDENSEQNGVETEVEFINNSFQSDGHWNSPIQDWGNPEKMVQQDQFWQVLQQCLHHLPERLQQLFLLREIFEEKSEKVCQELQISQTNLWTMLYRARMGLRHCFEIHWN